MIGFDIMMVITILMRRKSGIDVDCTNLVENCENDRSNLKSKHEGDEKGVRRQQYPTLLTLIKLMIVCYSHHQHAGPNSPDIMTSMMIVVVIINILVPTRLERQSKFGGNARAMVFFSKRCDTDVFWTHVYHRY